MTLACGLNMENVKGYAKIIDKAEPTYIETKAYVCWILKATTGF
jgi:wyosine [tRNA(Phe)-imidazoG37] synthetase (radical SAM superfamily)